MTQSANARTIPETGRGSAGLLNVLRERILSGRAVAGEFLPTVRKLSEKHGVAPGTAWRALKALESEGLVAAQPRRGYRVLDIEAKAASMDTVAYVLDQRNLAISWGPLYNQLLETAESFTAKGGIDLLKMIHFFDHIIH